MIVIDSDSDSHGNSDSDSDSHNDYDTHSDSDSDNISEPISLPQSLTIASNPTTFPWTGTPEPYHRQ